MRMLAATTIALAALAALAATTASNAQTAPERPRLVNCPAVMEHCLPGDYYFCVGGHRQADGYAKGAIGYFEQAAGWGHKRAQYVLGLMHFQGDGTPINRPLGLAWLALAAERDDRDMDAALAFARHHSSKAERQRAELLLAEMWPTYADQFTVKRAATRYERETRDLRRSLAFDPFSAVYIAGLGNGSASSMLQRMDERAERFFEGSRGGTVTVGSLKVVREEDTGPAGTKPSPDGER